MLLMFGSAEDSHHIKLTKNNRSSRSISVATVLSCFVSSIPLRLFAMAAISAHPTATLPSLSTVRPYSHRLPTSAFAASVARTPGVALCGCRRCNPFVRRFNGFQNAISLGKELNKQALFASGKDSPSSSDDSSDGPPVLTIVAGVIVFLLVLWVIGSLVTWILGLVFGAAKS